MRYELSLHKTVATILLLVLIVFLAVLLYLRALLSDQYLQALAALLIVMMAAVGFLFMGLVEGTIAFIFGFKHKLEFAAYLALGIIGIASGIFLTVFQLASLQTIALLAAPHAALLALLEFRIAGGMAHHPKQRRLLWTGGISESLMAIFLANALSLNAELVLSLLGFSAMISVLQILPFVLYHPAPQPHSIKGAL